MLTALILVISLLAYAWIVYPAGMLLIGRRRIAAHSAPPTLKESEWPPVAILFSAHNEEAVILKRLENMAGLDYPADRLQVFAGIDGGSDRTAEIALAWARSHPNVHVVVGETNHGKTAMLKRLVKDAGEKILPRRHGGTEREKKEKENALRSFQMAGTPFGKIAKHLSGGNPEERGDVQQGAPLLVFTDANTFFASDALRHLVAPFRDPKIGGVCGKLIFEKQKSESGGNSGQRGDVQRSKPLLPLFSSLKKGFTIFAETVLRFRENRETLSSPPLSSPCLRVSVVKSSPPGGTDEPVYWNLETRLKAAESSLDSCLGANGAIYAMRAGLFWDGIPDNTIIDDFVLGMKVREQGYRMVFEPLAVATEDLPVRVQDEWRRRVRIGSGAFQAMTLCRACLSPRYGWFAVFFWSHKMLRWFTPHLAVVGGVLLTGWLVPFLARSDAGIPLGVGVLVILALMALTKGGRKAFTLLGYFMAMQAALFAGFLKFCKGGLKGTWARTERG